MKSISALAISFIILLFLTSCDDNDSNIVLQIDGNLQNSEITAFQYGTHILNKGTDIYALKSNNIDLDEYANQNVVIVGEKIDGYPIDGGPYYINVLNISIVNL